MKTGMGRMPLSRVALVGTLALAAALLVSGGAAAAPGGAARTAASATAGSAAGAKAAGIPNPYIFVHDPSMARQGGTYYLFSTGDPAGVIGNGNIQIRTSRDLRQWTYTGTVFPTKPAWITTALGSIPTCGRRTSRSSAGSGTCTTPGSSFGSNNSVIGLATTPTLDPRSPRYHWTDRGLVFRSTSSDDFNAIDPSLVSAPDGGKWLVFGSFWSGIKLIALDAATGSPASPSPTVYSLASEPHPTPRRARGSPTTTATTT